MMGKRENLSGQIFGDFIVNAPDDTRGKYKYYWNCTCIYCGYPKSIVASSLKSGKSTRCNVCNNLFKTREIKGYAEDLSNQKFGYLIVNKFSHSKNSHSYWDCTCQCGNDVTKSIGFLRRGIDRMCDDCIEKYSDINNVMADSNLDKDGIPIVVVQGSTKKENSYSFKGNLVVINDKIIIDIETYPLIQKLNRSIYINNNGYACIFYGGRDVLLSRLILRLPTGTDWNDDIYIAEHINGNRLDNTKSNLRICTKEINPINCKIYENNTSGYKGVSWLSKLNKWQVSLQVGKKNYYLGVYKNLDDAIKVRKDAEVKYFGEYNRAEEHLHNGKLC